MKILFYRTGSGWVQRQLYSLDTDSALHLSHKLGCDMLCTIFANCTVQLYTDPSYPIFGMAKMRAGESIGLETDDIILE